MYLRDLIPFKESRNQLPTVEQTRKMATVQALQPQCRHFCEYKQGKKKKAIRRRVGAVVLVVQGTGFL